MSKARQAVVVSWLVPVRLPGMLRGYTKQYSLDQSIPKKVILMADCNSVQLQKVEVNHLQDDRTDTSLIFT